MNFKKLFLRASSLIVIIFITITTNMHTSNHTALWLVRHGQTDWNVQRRCVGQADVPLNQVGLNQAELAAHYLLRQHQTHPFAAVYSSDLVRAHTTAQAIASKINLPVCKEINLRETQEGIFEGLTKQEMREKFPHILKQLLINPEFVVPGAEPKQQATTRIIEVLKELVKKHDGNNVIIVTHHACLYLINRWIKENFPQENHPHVDPENASISLVVIENDHWRIAWWGKADHLSTNEVKNHVIQKDERVLIK